jgi:NitT/TauT family transport system permease protein
MVHCTEELRGKGFRPLSAHSRRDRGPLALLITIIVLLGAGARHMVASLSAGEQPDISLSPTVLSVYALRRTMRMVAVLVASLIFTFTDATLAAKSRGAEMVLIPLLDGLQSVPVLGYLSFTSYSFCRCFPAMCSGRSWPRFLRSSPVRPRTWRSAFFRLSGPSRKMSRQVEAPASRADNVSGASKSRLLCPA